MNIKLDEIIFFLLILARISSIIMTAPVFGSPSVPVRVKVGLSVILTFVFLPLAARNNEIVSWDFITVSLAIGREVLLGVMVGFIANLIFAAINLAGQMIGMQMGFAIVNIMDPLNQAQISIISQFLGFLALIFFVTLNFHYIFLEAIADSFNLVGLGKGVISGMVIQDFMKLAGEMFLIGLKIGAPLFAILIFTYVGLGILARTVPQMNVFIVGFPLTIGLGMIVLGLALPFIFEVVQTSFKGVDWSVHQLLKGI